jgi:chemotaxis protein CheZ
MNPSLRRKWLKAPRGEGTNMPVQRKAFRIEQMSPTATTATVGGEAPTARRDDDIRAELKALRELMERRGGIDPNADKTSDTLPKLREETEGIRRVLDRTRQEIAALHAGTARGIGYPRAARELDAIAANAERATQQILDAAEEIEDAASTLAASSKRKQAQALAQDIHDHVIRIFEACNFQDLSGQRIAKVLATLAFVEEHVARMMEIWGTDAVVRDSAAATHALPELAFKLETGARTAAMHGPRLDEDSGHASQDDIDRLFTTQ